MAKHITTQQIVLDELREVLRLGAQIDGRRLNTPLAHVGVYDKELFMLMNRLADHDLTLAIHDLPKNATILDLINAVGGKS